MTLTRIVEQKLAEAASRSGNRVPRFTNSPVSGAEAGYATGTKDKDYNLIWFTEQCLSNALRLESYIQDAERDGDNDLAFFRRAQGESRKRGEQGKEQVRKRLAS